MGSLHLYNLPCNTSFKRTTPKNDIKSIVNLLQTLGDTVAFGSEVTQLSTVNDNSMSQSQEAEHPCEPPERTTILPAPLS